MLQLCRFKLNLSGLTHHDSTSIHVWISACLFLVRLLFVLMKLWIMQHHWVLSQHVVTLSHCASWTKLNCCQT